jgi:serine protease Do
MRSVKLISVVALILVGAVLGIGTAYLASKLVYPVTDVKQTDDITQPTVDTLLVQTSPEIKPEVTPVNLENNISDTRRNAIVMAAERIGPAVVSISVTWTQIYRQTNPGMGADFWDFFFFGPKEYRKQVHSLGSGIIINPEGYVLTNDHVVSGAEQITVTLTNGEQYQANLIGSDESSDLAVVKIISGKVDFPYAILGNSDDLMAGEWAIAIGNPFGYLLDDTKPTVTVGVISAVNRDIKPEAGRRQVYRNMIQTDAAINPGNSGGPLVNSRGEVIGINSFIFTSSRGSEGVGFAIPVGRAKVIISDLISSGEVIRAWVGMRVARITPIVAQGLGLDVKNGLIVASVDEYSPAKSAGIVQGDVIIKAADEEIVKQSDWEEVITYARVGKTVELSLLRGDDTLDVRLMPEELPIKKAPSYSDRFGLEVVSITKKIAGTYSLKDDQGVMVAGWEENSAAAAWDLQEGDIIRRINRKKITSLNDYKNTIEKINRGYKVLFVIERAGELYYLAVVV